MRTTPVKKILLVALLVASLGSFLFLQEMSQFADPSVEAEISLVEDIELSQQDTYFPHIELVKKAVDIGLRIIKVGI